MKEINELKKEQYELEKKLKRLQLANRMLDLVFTIIGIGLLVVLYYIMKNS